MRDQRQQPAAGPCADDQFGLDPRLILDSLNDGVYVTDPNRRIVYWSKSAERITGWSAADTVGGWCSNNLLQHVDKDGRPLCGREYCPLHRAIITDQGSEEAILIFARIKDGSRIPVAVSVAPVHDQAGHVIGGVETFRDLSAEYRDLKRLRRIQDLALARVLPNDGRISFATHYVPHDIVGGDYYAITRLSADAYGFMLADVTGHGAAAALYTVHMASLWDTHCQLLTGGAGKFAASVSAALADVIGEDESFVTAVCGVVDLAAGKARLASAGGPAPLLFAGGRCEVLALRGLPLGVGPGTAYDETAVDFRPGDSLLLFTDGATEIPSSPSAAGHDQLGTDGLVKVLAKLGFPATGRFADVEEELLTYSGRIRFNDDLTFLQVRRAP
jgi:PAS domain S-box-containing protein